MKYDNMKNDFYDDRMTRQCMEIGREIWQERAYQQGPNTQKSPST